MFDVTRLFTPEYKRNPYPFYEEIREEGPVVRLDGMDSWIATGYDVVNEALRRPDLRSGMSRDFVATGGAEERWAERSPTTWQFVMRSMLFRDGVDHARLRRLVSKAFTPRVVDGLRPRVEAFVEELLDDVEPRSEMDLLLDFACPLPITVIAELLGVPAEDRALLKRVSQPLAAILDGMTRAHHLDEAEASAAELEAYLREQFARHRASPGDDLIDGLLGAADEGERLSEEELVATCILILVAGHETTTNLLGNGLLGLMQQRDAWETLCVDPSIAASAVEELLRFDGPVQFTARRAVGEIEIGGQKIGDDEELMIVLGAANRDPAHFADPNRLDLRRAANDHVSFGLGRHFCLGASLARMEAQVALAALARRLPALELAGDPESLGYRPGFAIRALEKLPVRW